MESEAFCEWHINGPSLQTSERLAHLWGLLQNKCAWLGLCLISGSLWLLCTPSDIVAGSLLPSFSLLVTPWQSLIIACLFLSSFCSIASHLFTQPLPSPSLFASSGLSLYLNVIPEAVIQQVSQHSRL